jgi:hypothetical protein
LGTVGYVSSFDSISSLNISSGNIITSTFRADYVSTNLIVGTVITQSLNPFSAGAQLGFGSNTSQNGFYGEGHFRSTFTQVIQPTLDNDGFSNILTLNGFVSSQSIRASTIVSSNIFTSTLRATRIETNTGLTFTNTFNLAYDYVSTGSVRCLYLTPQSGTQIATFGFAPINTTFELGNINTLYSQGWFRTVNVSSINASSIQTRTVSTNVLLASSLQGDGSRIFNLNSISSLSLQSTVVGLGTLGYISSVSSFQPNITSSIIGLGTVGYISSVSTFQPNITSSIIGLGTVGYISSVSTFQPNLTSSIIGLGTVGYISSTQLQSTVRGLGSIGYISSFQYKVLTPNKYSYEDTDLDNSSTDELLEEDIEEALAHYDYLEYLYD